VIKTGTKKLSKNRMVAMLDKACRQRTVIERDNDTCQRCSRRQGEWDCEIHRPTIIQWAHVHTRRHHCLRWDDDNTLALCSRCHKWFDNNKVLALDWFAKQFPERWDRIKRVLQSGIKVPTSEIKSMVQEINAHG